ncbi:hypothetical protein D4764_01G0011600, partial [Takifugu flavidus]
MSSCSIQCYCLKCKVFPGEDESASDKHAFRPGSLCSICTICEHCSSTCAQCPCEDGDQSDHCERCDECSSCYLCPILCDTVCTAGGVVDELSGSLFQQSRAELTPVAFVSLQGRRFSTLRRFLHSGVELRPSVFQTTQATVALCPNRF